MQLGGVAMTTRLMPLILVVTMLAIGLGCAKPDWIQQTLVTVDVTGTWRSTDGLMELTLLQEGQKVRGFMRAQGSLGSYFAQVSGPIEGIVTGDVFRFKRTGAVEASAEIEMLLSEDEMTGDTHAW